MPFVPVQFDLHILLPFLPPDLEDFLRLLRRRFEQSEILLVRTNSAEPLCFPSPPPRHPSLSEFPGLLRPWSCVCSRVFSEPTSTGNLRKHKFRWIQRLLDKLRPSASPYTTDCRRDRTVSDRAIYRYYSLFPTICRPPAKSRHMNSCVVVLWPAT